LAWVEAFRLPEILKIFMICEYCEWMNGSLQPVSPLLKGQLDGKEFSVADVIVLLRRAEFFGEEGTWMEF
jgi:glutathione S-transferase